MAYARNRRSEPQRHGAADGQPVSYVEAGEGDDGQRLDNFLLRTLSDVPRSLVYRILRTGEVRVNGGRAKPDHRLAAGDRIRLPPVQADAGRDGAATRRRRSRCGSSSPPRSFTRTATSSSSTSRRASPCTAAAA